jgi:hypothetical protein
MAPRHRLVNVNDIFILVENFDVYVENRCIVDLTLDDDTGNAEIVWPGRTTIVETSREFNVRLE